LASHELHRRSESALDEIIRHTGHFEEASHQAVAPLPINKSRLTYSRKSRAPRGHAPARRRTLAFDAALTLQQIASAHPPMSFRRITRTLPPKPGQRRAIAAGTTQSVTSRNLLEVEARINELKHQGRGDIFKSSEWYEKKSANQIQTTAEKALEHTSQFSGKGGESRPFFASELENSSPQFVAHSRTQIDEVVRDGFRPRPSAVR